jgi:hypothetical protein
MGFLSISANLRFINMMETSAKHTTPPGMSTARATPKGTSTRHNHDLNLPRVPLPTLIEFGASESLASLHLAQYRESEQLRYNLKTYPNKETATHITTAPKTLNQAGAILAAIAALFGIR